MALTSDWSQDQEAPRRARSSGSRVDLAVGRMVGIDRGGKLLPVSLPRRQFGGIVGGILCVPGAKQFNGTLVGCGFRPVGGDLLQYVGGIHVQRLPGGGCLLTEARLGFWRERNV